MELSRVCIKHQEAIGGFTVLYHFEEGENDICPVCCLRTENERLKKLLRKAQGSVNEVADVISELDTEQDKYESLLKLNREIEQALKEK